MDKKTVGEEGQGEVRCVYCGGSGPFNREHVFPAGVGGDDDRFVLENLVCEECNTKIFSPLELQFMRNSPVALARIFFQQLGRGKGQKASVPSLQTHTTTVVDPDDAIFLEAELSAGGTPQVLPQFIFDDGCKLGIRFRAGDVSAASAFSKTMRALLTDPLTLVKKNSGSKAKRYRMTEWEWGSNGIVEGATRFARKPVMNGIWIETLGSSSTSGNVKNCPRLFQRPRGQVVLRVDDEGCIVSMIEELKSLLSATTFDMTEGKSIEHPDMNLAFSMQIDIMERVLAKIGVNFAIYEFGGSFVSHAAFASVKEAVRFGTRRVRITMSEESDGLYEVFSGVPHNYHVLALATMPTESGQCVLFLLIRLYGGPIFQVLIAKDMPQPAVRLPVFFTVDYNSHKIERLDPLAYVQTFEPKWRQDADSGLR